jgi:stage II sporulation protein D
MLLEADGSYLRVNGNRYRGAIALAAQGDLVQVINVVEMESYLRGVVPSEMSASWPMEALKAQAVAARSYTLSSLDPSASYDLCATVDCQVDRGVEVEHPRTDAAVAATAGVVVTYGGATARTYYHADSGGMIASSQEVWGSALPYLVARADAPTSTPHRAWVYRLDAAVVGASLDAAGLGVGTVQGVRVIRLSESGRVVELEVSGTAGTRVVRGSQLTNMARGWGLKSTRFSVQGGLTVRGDGWGHGVGMSQYGARALAQAGYDFGRILAYFYPTTSLTQFVADGR